MNWWCCKADFGEHEMSCENYGPSSDCSAANDFGPQKQPASLARVVAQSNAAANELRSAHTPGPWSADRRYGSSFAIEPNVAWLGASASVAESTNAANARLIAEAPEMLQVIQRLAAGCIEEPEIKMLIQECRRIVQTVV